MASGVGTTASTLGGTGENAQYHLLFAAQAVGQVPDVPDLPGILPAADETGPHGRSMCLTPELIHGGSGTRPTALTFKHPVVARFQLDPLPFTLICFYAYDGRSARCLIPRTQGDGAWLSSLDESNGVFLTAFARTAGMRLVTMDRALAAHSSETLLLA